MRAACLVCSIRSRLLCGLVSVAMLTMQGAAWLSVKSEGEVSVRARRSGALAAILLVLLFPPRDCGSRWARRISHQTASSNMQGRRIRWSKSVTREAGAWLDNYRAYPWMIAAPALAYRGRARCGVGLRLLGAADRLSRQQPFGRGRRRHWRASACSRSCCRPRPTRAKA